MFYLTGIVIIFIILERGRTCAELDCGGTNQAYQHAWGRMMVVYPSERLDSSSAIKASYCAHQPACQAFCKCERRILEGKTVNSEKKFMVYLIRSPTSAKIYDEWICGGALVTTQLIVTSAACVEDVQNMYAIAGYKKYVPYNDLETDECTKKLKKKVVLVCRPKKYEFNSEKIEKWSNIDIGIAKVDTPYNFGDESYKTVCSYTPGIIPINYDPKYQQPGIEGFVLGWGHHEKWRDPNDTNTYNQKDLEYAPVVIYDKQQCIKHYDGYPDMSKVIETYMICTLEKGNIDADGNIILKLDSFKEGCSGSLRYNPATRNCEIFDDNSYDGIPDEIPQRRAHPNDYFITSENVTRIQNMTLTIDYKHYISNNSWILGRKSGICQNDHGGPLVTWIGSKEYLIGVASVFMIHEGKCTGPFLYTSTQCNGAFLNCLLIAYTRSDLILRDCSRFLEKEGIEMIETHVAWDPQSTQNPRPVQDVRLISIRPQIPLHEVAARENHPLRPVQNLELKIRPQIPINEAAARGNHPW